MTPSQLNPHADWGPDPLRWSRADATQALADFLDPEQPHRSQRAFAQQAGVPRATLQHWLQRRQQPDLAADRAAFLESSAGHDFLRRRVLAAQLVFHLAGPTGLRPWTRFLRLTQLDHFVAASFGSQQALAVQLQEKLVAYAAAERQRLGAAKPATTITAGLDENFHGPQPCLVAVEPQSNFLLLEAYHPQRDGDTWTTALQQALDGLSVTVVQVTSDPAQGLLACARDGLEAQHTPDLFHGQRELSRAVAGPLARHTQTAEQERLTKRAATVRECSAQAAPSRSRLVLLGALSNVRVNLSGTDDRGQAVAAAFAWTDAEGTYKFLNLRPGNYTLTQEQPVDFVDGTDTSGEVNGVPMGSTGDDQFSAVLLDRPDSVGANYNFGERPPAEGRVVGSHQTATIGFWHNKKGQALIKSLNGGPNATQLGDWLAATFGNLYGHLAGMTNADVATYYAELFRAKGRLAFWCGAPKVDAQVLATALAIYVTNQTLAGTTATAYGFTVTEAGLGTQLFNVGCKGVAFEVAKGSRVAVLDLLLAANVRSSNGLLYDRNGDGDTNDPFEKAFRIMANDVFTSINEAGHV